MPITEKESLTVSLDGRHVRQRVLSWFTDISHAVVRDAADQLEIKSGSQVKLRILGGAFIADASLPARTVVTMSPRGDRTQVTITACDAMGFGAKTGIKSKYELWIAHIVDGLHAALTDTRESVVPAR